MLETRELVSFRPFCITFQYARVLLRRVFFIKLSLYFTYEVQKFRAEIVEWLEGCIRLRILRSPTDKFGKSLALFLIIRLVRVYKYVRKTFRSRASMINENCFSTGFGY